MKSEPEVFGIGHLKARPKQTAHWDGVRNYQARNFLRDKMKRGDRAFLYHSSCAQPAIVGIMEITRASYPDFTAWERGGSQYDPRSTPEKPVWYMVDVRLVRELKRPVTLTEIKRHRALKNMPLVQRGNRLSVMPVTAREWQYILKLERA